jgi:hypothetical protein
MDFTKTEHADSPDARNEIQRLAHYAEFGDVAIEMVKKAVNQTQSADDARKDIQYFMAITAGDRGEPTEWRYFIGPVAAVVDAAARAESADQREKLGVAALRYLERKLDRIKIYIADTPNREKFLPIVVPPSKLAGEAGVTYLTDVFDQANTSGIAIRISSEEE